MISEGSVKVLAALADGPATWADLREDTGLSESTIYERLCQLRTAGVVSQTPIIQDDRAMSEYALRDGCDDLGDAAAVIVAELG